MKKAVIITGSKQYLVTEGDVIDIEKLAGDKHDLEGLLLIDGEKVSVGQPFVDGLKVQLQVLEPEIKADKVLAIRYKAKKRVHKVRGHRQKLSRVKVAKITAKQ